MSWLYVKDGDLPDTPGRAALPHPGFGGKHRLAKRICAIIDADDHTTYAEPFVGMGGVFLKRTRRPGDKMILGAR